jgi:hypothetical protein
MVTDPAARCSIPGKRRFAAAGLADEGQYFACHDIEGDVIHGEQRRLAVLDADMFHRERR